MACREIDCPDCGGTGLVFAHEPCSRCRGKGKITVCDIKGKDERKNKDER